MTPDYEQGWREGTAAFFRVLLAEDSGGFIPAECGIEDKDGMPEDWIAVGWVFTAFQQAQTPREPVKGGNR